MPTARSSDYKGHRITTRWAESPPSDRPLGKRFAASFAVRPMNPEADPWQHFPPAMFDTYEGAEANALDAAQRSIDDLPARQSDTQAVVDAMGGKNKF